MIRRTVLKFTDLSLKGIRIHRRRGRKKEDLNGKQSGGNELIADIIFQITGVKRCRKQVSSHLQVLKGFMAENKPCGSDSSCSQPQDADCFLRLRDEPRRRH